MILIASFFHFSIVCVPSDRDIETQEEIDEETIRQKNKLDV